MFRIFYGSVRFFKFILVYIEFRLTFDIFRLIFISKEIKNIRLQIWATNNNFFTIFRRTKSIIQRESRTFLLQIILDALTLKIYESRTWRNLCIASFEFENSITRRINFFYIVSIWNEILITSKNKFLLLIFGILKIIWFEWFTHFDLVCGKFLFSLIQIRYQMNPNVLPYQ